MRVVDSAADCTSKETALTWNQRGPQRAIGATGATGAKGDTGPAGPQGDAGPAGPQGDAGPAGPQGDAGPAGPQGDVGPAGAQGDVGPAGPAGTSAAYLETTPSVFDVGTEQVEVAELVLPEGDYVVRGDVELQGRSTDDDGQGHGHCVLGLEAPAGFNSLQIERFQFPLGLDRSFGDFRSNHSADLEYLFRLPREVTVSLRCAKNQFSLADLHVQGVSLSATQVTSTHLR